MCCLLARTTLTVNSGAWNCFGKTSCENCVTCNVEALLAHLHNAAHDHVVDECRINVVALNEGFENCAGEVDGMPFLQATIALAQWCAKNVDDDCILHMKLLESVLGVKSDR